MAKSSGGLFSGGDPSLIAAAGKAGAALKPTDLSTTFQGVATSYASAMEKVGAGYGKLAGAITQHAIELYGEELGKKTEEFARNAWVDIRTAFTSKKSGYDGSEAIKHPEPEIATYETGEGTDDYSTNIGRFDTEADFNEHRDKFKVGDFVKVGDKTMEVTEGGLAEFQTFTKSGSIYNWTSSIGDKASEQSAIESNWEKWGFQKKYGDYNPDHVLTKEDADRMNLENAKAFEKGGHWHVDSFDGLSDFYSRRTDKNWEDLSQAEKAADYAAATGDDAANYTGSASQNKAFLKGILDRVKTEFETDTPYKQSFLKEYTPPPPPAKSVTIGTGAQEETIRFTNGKDYFASVLKPAREHQREMERKHGRGSKEAQDARDRYRSLRGAWLTSTATFRQARESLGDLITNNGYSVDASEENVPFVRAILKEGEPLEDGSYVRMGTDADGNISFTWVDENGQVKMKGDGVTPWTATRHNVNRLLVPKNAEVDAAIIAQNTNTLKAGAAPLYGPKGELLNGVDNKEAYDTYYKNKYINDTINGVNNSGDPDMAYRYATSEKSGFATQSFTEAVNGVQFKDGKMVGKLTWINEEMWKSLQGISGLDTDGSGTVDAKDFATLENYTMLKNKLLSYSPESLSVFANWRSEEVGRKEYEDGQRRQKKGKGDSDKDKDKDKDKKKGKNPFTAGSVLGLGNYETSNVNKDQLWNIQKNLINGDPIDLGQYGDDSKVTFIHKHDGWEVIDYTGDKKVIESGLTTDDLVMNYISTNIDEFLGLETESKKPPGDFSLKSNHKNYLREFFTGTKMDLPSGQRTEKGRVNAIKSYIERSMGYPDVAKLIGRSGKSKHILFNGKAYDMKGQTDFNSFITAIEAYIKQNAPGTKYDETYY